MNNINLRTITNRFQDVRLGSLSSWRARADEFIPHDAGGPYVVTQEGYAPDDATYTPDEFILHRSGEWLSLSHFFQIPEPDRAEFVFRTSAEVIQLMNSLPTKVRMMGAMTKEAKPAASEVDEMAAAREKETGGATDTEAAT